MLRSTRPVRWQKFHDIYFGVELERNEREQKPLEHPLHSNPHILIQRSREKPNKRFRKLCSTHLNFKGKKFQVTFHVKLSKCLSSSRFEEEKLFEVELLPRLVFSRFYSKRKKNAMMMMKFAK